MKTREMTPHQVIAQRCGLHPNALAVFQRLDVVPRNVVEITDAHVGLLRKLKTLMTDPVLLNIQLHRLGKEERKQLIECADDAVTYKSWERRALKMFATAYQEAEGEEVTTGKVLGHLQKRFKIQPTPHIKYRVEQLRMEVEERVKKGVGVLGCEPVCD